MRKAHKFVRRVFEEELANPETIAALIQTSNPKGELVEYFQGIGCISPVFTVLCSTGPPHKREFEVAVAYAGEELGRGVGKSIKEAEAQAAKLALTQVHVHQK